MIRIWFITTALLAAIPAGAAQPSPKEEPRRYADPSYALQFPRDHGSHPAYGLEWWYFTGNTTAEDGRRFGFQLTFFRVALDQKAPNPSKWAADQLYLAHAAVSDAENKRLLYAERMQRGALGLAGAAPSRMEVWNGPWRAAESEGRLQLTAAADEFSFDLQLTLPRAPVLHGRSGYSRKGRHPKNASHYYSYTRLPIAGAVAIGKSTYEVEGEGWMDHEFGTSFLDEQQVGWDWFALQLDSGPELMLYQFREKGGKTGRFSSGTIVEQGAASVLDAADFALEPLSHWTSAKTGARYPIRWRITVPSRGLELTVEAVFPSQELTTEGSTGVTYWEGAVDVRRGQTAVGRGYLEMTGYSAKPMSAVLSGN